ncbi:MAG: hypothetical protein KAY24_18970 [Candidatus Eisenbacteria sp.]|nr:hypothetical protein [Candidatus Eisenbacteria bacterium]
MRIAAWMAFVLAAVVAVSAGAREWYENPLTVPDWDERTDAYLGCESGEILGYAIGENWADEVQLTFQLPEPALEGPWLVEYVALFVSGTGIHHVTIREAGGLSDAPGEIVADDLEFSPLYASWPPAAWTYVALKNDIACPPHLMGGEGDCFTIGAVLLPGDRIGLASAEPGNQGWGLYQGTWHDDTGRAQLIPAVRIGITDLGTSSTHRTTWGAIKDLFK